MSWCPRRGSTSGGASRSNFSVNAARLHQIPWRPVSMVRRSTHECSLASGRWRTGRTTSNGTASARICTSAVVKHSTHSRSLIGDSREEDVALATSVDRLQHFPHDTVRPFESGRPRRRGGRHLVSGARTNRVPVRSIRRTGARRTNAGGGDSSKNIPA